MTKREILVETPEEPAICPFTQPRGKRVGDALLAVMFILVPIILIIYILIALN